MAQVWEARHRSRGMRVAVKFLPPPTNSKAMTLVENEILAAARLTHRGIVATYDFGVVTEALSVEGMDVKPGTPYLVMERAAGGSLSHWLRQHRLPTWEQSRDILVQILQALAHAHAHGVLHRDIKPANVLLMYPDALGRLKLTDFGIAHVDRQGGGRGLEVLERAGTPSYIAPEQLRGSWRELGPAADMYSVGCLAWRLVTGRPPFAPLKGKQLIQAHLYKPPRTLDPNTPVPPKLEAWLRWLLEKNPADRPHFAADALKALTFLGTPRPMPRREGMQASSPDEPTLPDQHETRATPSPAEVRAQGARPGPAQGAAGLGLFGLRVLPALGRELEMGKLWDLLTRTDEDQQSHAAWLIGDGGCGKSHLARSFCRAVHEGGVALPIVVSGVHESPMNQGLSRVLRLAGAEPAEAHSLLIQRLPQLDRGVRELAVRWLARNENLPLTTRWVVCNELLRELAKERPVVVVVDDIDRAPAAGAWAAKALDLGLNGVPIFLIATTSESLTAHPLWDHPRSQLLPLNALPRLTVQRMLRLMAEFSPSLASRVANWSEGNPGRAVNLAESLANQGDLKRTPEGYTVAATVRLPAPQSLLDSWRPRIRGMLTSMPLPQRESAVMVAVLGRQFNESWWTRACEASGAPPDRMVLSRLSRAGIIRAEGGSWVVSNPAGIGALEQVAKELHLWRHLCDRAGHALRDELDPGLARDLFTAAGNIAHAISSALEEAEQSMDEEDYEAAWVALDQLEDLLMQGNVPPERNMWEQLWRHRVRVARIRGHWKQHDRSIAALEAHADDWPRTAALLACERGVHSYRLGKLDEAEAELRTAIDVGMLRDPISAGNALLFLAQLHDRAGRFGESAKAAENAAKLFGACGRKTGEADACAMRAQCSMSQGNLEEADDWLNRADQCAREAGSLHLATNILNGRANLQAFRGNLDGAIANLREALRVQRLMGVAHVYILMLNLALRHLEKAEPGNALEVLEQLQREDVPAPTERHKALLHLLLGEAHAISGDAVAAYQSLRVAERRLAGKPYVDAEIAKSLERTAMACVHAHPPTATVAARMALAIRKQLPEDPDEEPTEV